MKTWISILASLITFITLAEEVTPSEPMSCDSIDDCKALIIDRGLAREAEKYGMKKADTLLAKHIKLMGDMAIPMLMELIQHQSYSVRRLAGFTLMKFEEIDEKYLPIIIKALDNETPWLVNALGDINSPAAAEEAVKRYLFSISAPHNQEFNALKNSGNLAVPYIIEALKCEVACPNDYIYNFGVTHNFPVWEASVGFSYQKQGDSLSVDMHREVELSYGANLEVFIEKRFGEGYVLRLSGTNLLDAHKIEKFTKYDGDSGQEIIDNHITGNVDGFELEDESSGRMVTLTLRKSF